jgi:uncharacterized protein YhaN
MKSAMRVEQACSAREDARELDGRFHTSYIENHCAENAPCPVILDDALMAFDDERASAALKVLQELSKKTQVLVFTHHAHHVKLAESVLGEAGFQLHELER